MVKIRSTPDPEYRDPLKHPDSVQVIYRPVLQEPLPPIPNPDNDGYSIHRDWWREQVRRCVEGWVAPNGTFINPIYYFFLNFCTVFVVDELDKGRKKWQNPYVRDGDKEYFDEVYYNMSREVDGQVTNAVDLIVGKARRKGWTTCELHGITMWFFIFKTSENISRAYPTDKIKNKERKAFIKAYSFIHPFFKMGIDNVDLSLVEKNEDAISQGYYLNKDRIITNSIFFFTISADGSSVRGDAIGLIVVVEAGIHTNLKTFKGAADEALGVGDFKFGMTLIGGTSDMIGNKSTDYKDLFYNAAEHGMTKIFTPAWKCWYGAIDYFTGKSLRAKATESISLRREKKKKAGIEALRMHIQENPFTAEEAFIPNGDSEYDADKIDAQLMHILREGLDKEWIRGKLEWEKDTYGKKTGRVVFHQNPAGDHCILDVHGLPVHKVENLYLQGIDDVYKDLAPHSDSKNALITYMRPSIYVPGPSDMPVHYYLGRTNNMLLDWEEFEKSIVYYKYPDIMYEHNTESFLGYAREKGFFEKFLWHAGQVGVRLSDAHIQSFTMLGLKFFNNDRHLNITSYKIMESFKYWGGSKNSDLASAMHLVFFGLDKTKNKGTVTEDTVQKVEYINFGVQESWSQTSLNSNPKQAGFFSFGRG